MDNKICVVCGNIVEPNVIINEFDYIFTQVNELGMDSLTEFEQIVCEWHCCSHECFDRLGYVKNNVAHMNVSIGWNK